MSIRFLKQLPTVQNEKTHFASIAIDEILNGEVSILEAFAVLKHIEDTLEMIKSNPDVKNALSDELAKYPKGQTSTALGYSISIGERKNWDYSETGDEELKYVKENVTHWSNLLKAREKFLQSLTQKMVDAENGGFEITPPKVTFTTYPILKENKNVEIPVNDGLPF